MVLVAGKEAKDLTVLYNIPGNDVTLVRRHHIVTSEADSGDSYMLPSPADLALEEQDKALMRRDASAKSGVPGHVDTCLSGFQCDWYGIERSFRNIGIPGALPSDEVVEDIAASEPTSPRSSQVGLTMPDQTARLNYLYISPISSFVVPRIGLQPVVYETGPNADAAISESLSADDIAETEGGIGDVIESSEEPSMIEVSVEEERKSFGARGLARDRSMSEAVQVNIAALKESAMKDKDPIDPSLLAPSEQGKAVFGVNRDLLFGQLYPLPDAPHVSESVAPDMSSLGMRFKITPKELSFGFQGLEPYFGILALFDLTTGERLSENFYFDVNPETTLSMLPAWHEAAQWSLDAKPGHVRSDVEALFWVPHASTDIWLVLRVEKVLQGDSYDNVIEPYMRPESVKGKEREKLETNATSFTSRLGAFRQPLCWGMVPLFTEDKQYAHGQGAIIKQLNRYKTDVSNAAFLEASADVKTGSKRLKFIPGTFTFDLTPISDTSIGAATGGNDAKQFLDWTGRLCSIPASTLAAQSQDDQNSDDGDSHKDEDGKKKKKRRKKSADDDAGSDEDDVPSGAGGASSKSAQDHSSSSSDKPLKKLRKERSSVQMTTKAMKLLGATGGQVLVAGAHATHVFPYVPDYYPMAGYVQQVACFPAPAVPYDTPHNFAFVYPTQLTISKSIGQTVARNLAVQVSLLNHEDDDITNALHSVFTRAHVNPLSNSQFTIVNYHDKSPQFYDEFKIALPTRITKSHSLRFTFYHVQCQGKAGTGTGTLGSSSSSPISSSSSAAAASAATSSSGASAAAAAAAAAAASASSMSSILTMIGYSIFPILNNDMIPEGEITLPIMSVGDGSSTGSLTSSKSSSSSPSGTAGSGGNSNNGSQPATIMDPKKANFSFRLKLASSIYTSDKYLHPFFQEYGKLRLASSSSSSSTSSSSSGDAKKGQDGSSSGNSSEKGSSSSSTTSLTNALTGLIKVKPRKLLQFLPVILHQLFYIMCTQPVSMSNKAFSTLVQVLHNIHHKESEMQVASLTSVLHHYLDYQFMSPPNISPLVENPEKGVTFRTPDDGNSPFQPKAPPSIANTLHTQITRAWCTLVNDTAKNDHERLHRFCWFFFKLIYLSASSFTLDIVNSSLKESPNTETMCDIATHSLLALSSLASSSSSSPAEGSPSSSTSTSSTSPSKSSGDHKSSSGGDASASGSGTSDFDASKDSRDRIARFSADFKIALKKLVLLLSWEVQERLNTSLQLAKELSRKIASFLVDMLSICDRGFIIDLALRALKEIAPREDESCWEMRADFWKILASYEHWPQLSLPLTMHIDSKNVGNLEEFLAQKHFVQGALLRDLVFAPMTDKTSRMRGLHIVQSLFLKADLDPRLNPSIMSSVKLSQDGKAPAVYNYPPVDLEDSIISSPSGMSSSSGYDSKRSSRKSMSRRSGSLRSRRAGIHQMALSDPTTSVLKAQYLQGYFPLILRGVDHFEALRKADFDEQRVFLSCWIYLIKNIDIRLLRQWWKCDSFTRNAGFLQCLALCAQVFEYQGSYAHLLKKLSYTSEITTRAVATKALIEELYSEGGTSSAMGSATVGNLRQRRMENLKMKGTNAGTLGHVSQGSSSSLTGASSSQDPPNSARSNGASTGTGATNTPNATPVGSLSAAAGANLASQIRDDYSSTPTPGQNQSPSNSAAGSGKISRRNRHKGYTHQSNSSAVDKDSLHKWKHPGLDSERGRYESNSNRESRISNEVSLVILDCLEWYLVAKESDLNSNSSHQSNPLMDSAVGVLMSLLSRRQGIDLQILVLRVLTAFAHTFPKQLFVQATSYMSQLMPRVLALCNYEYERVRMSATAFFFLLMKLNLENSPAKHKNFTRVKVQSIIALSKLVAGRSGIRDLSFLNRALNGVQSYAEQYNAPASTSNLDGTSSAASAVSVGSAAKSEAASSVSSSLSGVEGAFLVQQVTRLSSKLRGIMEGSIKIQQHAGDNDMLTDLYHQIASSYRTAPDLRVTWLESLAELHARNDAWAEAGQCLVHIAALIAEYLQILEPTDGSMKGAAAFEPACASAVEEQSMLDAQNMMDEDGVGETRIFTERGLVDVVERSIAYLTKAQLYESSHELYKLLLPVHEKAHDYAKLATSHLSLSNIFSKIVETMNNQSRLFGSYYRVGFYGKKFGDLNGKEFVYKEPKITRLGEIQDRLLALYGRKLGTAISVITTSGEVSDQKKLEADACYMQLTHVQPYFDDWELKQRKTDYERNNNIGRFIFETPFTKSAGGKTQSPSLQDQWKRKTILTVENTFPYMKRRLLIVNKEAVELSPIETAIEGVEGRVQAITAQLEHPNAKTLPLVLQGSVRSAVNVGPTEISKVFLAPGSIKTFGIQHTERLKIALQDFLDICQEALLKNKEIIASAQLNFHQELEDGYTATKAIIEPMLSSGAADAK